MQAARYGLMILAAAMLVPMAGMSPAAAQDADEIYAINRRDAEQRAARRGEAPQSRASIFPGFNLFGQARRDVPEITVRPGPAGNGRHPPADSNAEAATDSSENPGGPRAFCVRLCDGFFFPAGSTTGGAGRNAQQATCNSLCPGTEMALYSVASRGTIADATSSRGQTYASLRTAFLFRQRVENACTCHGGATNGLARLPITHDHTLRAGDIVVTEAGVRVFSGGPRFPYRAQDFVAARAYGRLPVDVQRRVAEIEAGLHARDAGSQAPVARLGGTAARRAGIGQTAVQASLPVTSGSVTQEGVRVLDLTRATETTIR
ncbi:DUF2865 domain-containing protein [Phreatobacter aquaticus]|nr:DUF2865 domain-containing protein [Phreatobacter aquaticus]